MDEFVIQRSLHESSFVGLEDGRGGHLVQVQEGAAMKFVDFAPETSASSV